MDAIEKKYDLRNLGIGMEKYFSPADPYTGDVLGYLKRDVIVKNDSGEVVEEIKGTIFPDFWSQNAANTAATKYFRKEGVPETGREIDVRQLAGRVAQKIAYWGKIQNYFSNESQKDLEEIMTKNIEHEIVASTVYQYGAYNSPVWFNVGLDLYGIKQESPNFYVENDEIKKAENYYEHPQASACFIVSPEDSIESMINVGAVISSRIFKNGSGIGGDWSKVRSAGEPISGGGGASGATRFMDMQDSCGRVIKSGGKTRRAATMQSIGVWHPDMPEVLKHKYKEEQKAKILIEAGSPSNWESHTIQDLRAQNVNISIRTDDKFWEAYEKNESYEILRVKDGSVVKKEPARKLTEMMSFCNS